MARTFAPGAAQHYVDLKKLSHFDYTHYVDDKEMKELEDKAPGVIVDKNNTVKCGVRDIDVWFFFEQHPHINIPSRGNSRKSYNINLSSIGELQLDILKKAIKPEILEKANSKKPDDLVRTYILQGGTGASHALSLKSIVGLYPENIFDMIIWSVKRVIK